MTQTQQYLFKKYMNNIEKLKKKIELKKENNLDTSMDEVELVASMFEVMIRDENLSDKVKAVEESFKEQREAYERIDLPPFPMAQIETLVNVMVEEINLIALNDNPMWHLKYIGILIQEIYFIADMNFGPGKRVEDEDIPSDNTLGEWISNVKTIIQHYKKSIKSLNNEEMPFWAIILFNLERKGYDYLDPQRNSY